MSTLRQLQSADRQRAYRERHSGRSLSLRVSEEQYGRLRQAYDDSGDGAGGWTSWLVDTLLRGSAFRANAGRPRGQKRKGYSGL